MIRCTFCNKEIGQGSTNGLVFCNDGCTFNYAMNIPLDLLSNDPEIKNKTTTIAEGVVLLAKARVGGVQ